jgi:hypothetical protein
MLAMLLQSARALLAIRLQARGVLRTNTNAVADLDALLGLLANPYSLADDLVTDTAWVWRRSPARAQSMQVGAADAAVGDLRRCRKLPGRECERLWTDLNVDICLLERLDVRELAPLHLALGALWTLAEPSLELIVLVSHVRCNRLLLAEALQSLIMWNETGLDGTMKETFASCTYMHFL